MLIAMLLAQAVAAAAPDSAPPADGVISYPPAFFAAQQPPSALDMVQRLPGFAFSAGDAIRGYEGGGGNVLIDGQRPASKTDNLEELLRRIPAGQVERIDLIRGGAPLPPRAAARRAVSINVAAPDALSIAPLKMLSPVSADPLNVPT